MTGQVIVCPNFRCVVGPPPSPPPLDDCPVSLRWSGQNFGASLTQFPLNPKYLNKWFIWHASAALPLLVFDPEHKGIITGPEQLIGNYSFGKKWDNGYLALRSLDSDRDHQLAGDELAPLSLWFDENQDGLSQPGEVKSLTVLEVKRIYFANYQVDFFNGESSLKIGFKRIENGRIITGGSYDWASFGAYNSQADAQTILKFLVENKPQGGLTQ